MARYSQILGEALEQRLSAQATLPVWVKVPTRRTVKGRAQAGSVWLDYVGCTARGRFVTADAKALGSCARVTASLLTPAQRRHADQALSARAVVVVIVGWPWDSAWKIAVIPWSELRAGGVDPGAWVSEDWCRTVEDMGDDAA